MTTNREWLYSLDVADLSDWLDAEHVDNARSAKRAAAVERVRKAKDAGTSIGYAIVGREYYPWEAYETLIELLTDDDGLRNNDGVAAEHGATRMTNLERLFVDSEQFRQAVSAFAFAHSDDCPTSPTQMVDWLMAPYVDAQSKDQSKDAPALSDLYGILSDANDDLAPESDVTEDAVDANDENATCNNSGDFVTDDSREKLEADVRQYANPSGDTGTLGACWEKTMLEFLDRQAEITHAETIHTYNLAAREARKVQEERISELQANVESLKAERDYWRTWYLNIEHDNSGLQAKVDELHDELAKRDKGIARLKRQRDEARRELKKWEELTANIELPDYPFVQFQPKDKDRLIDRLTHERDEARDFLASSENLNADLRAMNDALADDNDRLEAERDKLKRKEKQLGNELGLRDKAIELLQDVKQELIAERDNLAADLLDCERQRERLRQALGTAIDHAHETVSLVNLDGEVIG